MEKTNNPEEQTTSSGKRMRRDYRDSDMRSMNERPALVFRSGNQFNYGEAILSDKRYKFGWIPYIIANEEVHMPHDNAVSSGWELTSSDEYPSLKRTYRDPFNRNRDSDDIIRVGGCLSMRIPVEIWNAENERYNEENAHQEKMVGNFMSHSRTKGNFPY